MNFVITFLDMADPFPLMLNVYFIRNMSRLFCVFILTAWCVIDCVCKYNVYYWPGLGLPRPKAIVVIPKNQPLPKHLRKKRVKVRSTPANTLQKKDPLK